VSLKGAEKVLPQILNAPRIYEIIDFWT